MNKHILTFAAILSMIFVGGGCEYNDENFEGLQKGSVATDVKRFEYTLTGDDYTKLAGLAANKTLAGDTDKKALEAVGKNKYFTPTITAAKYLPAWLASTYPTADNTSAIKVTSSVSVGLPEELTAIQASKEYTLTDADYKVVWGDEINAAYFTPAKPAASYLPRLLKTAMTDPAAGDYVVAEYAYSDQEPSTGGDEPQETVNKISDVVAAGSYIVQGKVSALYARGFMVDDGTGAILVYLNAPANFSLGDVVKVKGEASSYNDGMQFGSSAEFTLVEKTKNFAFPTPTVMDGAALDNYLTSVSAKFVSLTGTLTISSGRYNLAVEGAGTAVGSISYPLEGQVDDGLNGKVVTATGYLFAVSKSGGAPKYPNMMLATIAEKDATPLYTPVGIIAAADPGDFSAKGQVAATYGRGFLLNDGTGSILVYNSSLAGLYAVGDMVTVSGKVTAYAGLNQFGTSPVVTKLNESAGTFKYPAIRELGGTDMDACLTLPAVQYVSYTGQLVIDGNFYNVINDEALTAQGSLSYVATGVIDASLNGKKVVVKGYTIGVSNKDGAPKFLNTMVLSVEEAAAAPATSSMTRAAVTKTRYAVYAFDGSAWAAADATTIVNPEDYTAMGLKSSFSSTNKPESYLPTFLKLTKPYAQAEDAVFVAYDYYDGSAAVLRADQYLYDGAQWTKNNGVVEQTDQFVKSNGKWTWNPSVTVILPVGKNQALSAQYYQACVDWVKANVDSKLTDGGYVTTYGNNDYYSGASAYQGNLDWRVSAARGQYAAGYAGMSDDEVLEALKQHTIEVFREVLPTLHPEAKVISGVDVTYTIQVGVYKGTTITAPNYKLVYKVIGDAEFEFVSFDEL